MPDERDEDRSRERDRGRDRDRDRPPEGSGWRIDKTVSIALLMSVLMPTISVVWMSAHDDATLSDHGRRIVKLETDFDAYSGKRDALIASRNAQIDALNSRVDAEVSELKSRDASIEAKLDDLKEVIINRTK